jgi:hypothetical protein
MEVDRMTAKELQKRNGRSENLRVLQTEDLSYYVESSEGKILYNVILTDEEVSCTCGDWARNSKREANFKCKHILSVLNCIPNGEVEGAHFLDRKKPRLDERWIIELEGHKFVKYAGLLDYAHQIGISQIDVSILQFPDKDNGSYAICRATVISKRGDSFSDIGDANPTNCNVKVAKHLLRLASTRAIARALRTLCNVGLPTLEEISDINDVIGNGSDSKRPKIVRNAGSQLKTVKKPDSAPEKPAEARDENQKPQIQTDKSDNSDGSKSKGNGSGRQPSTGKASEPNRAKDTAPAETQTETKIPEKQTVQPMMSEAQKRAIYNLSRRRGISVEELERMSFEAYGLELQHLTSRDASSFIRSLQQAS